MVIANIRPRLWLLASPCTKKVRTWTALAHSDSLSRFDVELLTAVTNSGIVHVCTPVPQIYRQLLLLRRSWRCTTLLFIFYIQYANISQSSLRRKDSQMVTPSGKVPSNDGKTNEFREREAERKRNGRDRVRHTPNYEKRAVTHDKA